MNDKPFLQSLSVLLLAWALGLAQAQAPVIDPASLSGDVRVSGSPSVVPLVQNLSTLFGLAGFRGNINLRASDSAAALVALCQGALDVALTDRLISPDESAACQAAGRRVAGLRLANDALLIVTSQQNTFFTDVTASEAQLLFSGALNWNEVRPTFAAQPIVRLLPSQETAEFQAFVRVVFGGDARPLLLGIGTQFSTDQNILIQGIGANPNAVGFVGAGLANRNAALVRAVPFNGVTATAETVASGAYPLARPLYLYVTDNSLIAPQVIGFVRYALANVNSEVGPLGLYPNSPAALAQAEADLAGLIGTVIAPAPISTEEARPAVPTSAPEVGLVDDGEAIDLPDEEASQSALPPAVVTPTSLLSPEEITQLLIDARADLELLAAQVYGVGRPEGWNGSLDPANPQLNLLVRLDLEVMIADRLGSAPEGWFGIVASTPFHIARDIRHDLELAADLLLGRDVRPSGWRGSETLYRCNRATQTLVALLERGSGFVLSVPEVADPRVYCAALEQALAAYSETVLLTRPAEQDLFSIRAEIIAQNAPPPEFVIPTNFAVGFFDRGAARRAGVIPSGTPFVPVARSYVRFSTMTLVQGEGFLLYVDRSGLGLDDETWRALPNVDEVSGATFCQAAWCTP
ncbi:MAG: substrate-binding domain-containing protein [Anaerolineae bacterium]|nr:substrate-binding domain-containing protein [Anaerolineae bacterium]MDW8173522.1 substrate-binding domain-containing protein [Anaerolineae bacterium]